LEHWYIFINIEQSLLDDPIPKVLYPEIPHVWFKPVKSKDLAKKDCFDCPVYRTSKRAGELLTTGQSTNFLISICNSLLI
jgi:dynein heavy chain